MSKANPFSDNPFTANGGSERPAAPSAGAWGPSAGGSSSAGIVPAYTADAAVPSVAPKAGKPGKSKETDFAAREAELNAREAELKRWEADLRSSGRLKPKKNWPKCCPITTMDIKAEVPKELQYVVGIAYLSYLGLVLCLLYQVAAVIVALALFDPKGGRLSGFFLALLYALIGIPGAWVVWYIRLYTASIKDRAFTYAWFFLAYLVHILWCIWSAISPPILFQKWSFAGWMTALISALPNKTVVGIVYIVGAILWSAESLLSFWVLKCVYTNFRGNKGQDRLKNEAMDRGMQAAVNHAVNRV